MRTAISRSDKSRLILELLYGLKLNDVCFGLSNDRLMNY